MTDIRPLLESYHLDILKDMAVLLGVEVDTNRKYDYIEALVRRFAQPLVVEQALSKLGDRERRALEVLQRSAGRMEANRLRVELMRHGIIEPPSQERSRYRYGQVTPGSVVLRENQRTTFEQVVGRLMAVGLVHGHGTMSLAYSNRTKIHYDNVRELSIPPEVQEQIPEPAPLPAVRVPMESLNRVEEGSARTFQRDLYFYWSTAHTTPLSLTKEGRLYKRDLRLVNDALMQPAQIGSGDEPDYPRLIFMRLFLTDMGLLRREDGSIAGVNRPEFLGRPPTERIRHTFEQWRDGTFWNELLSVPKITLLGGMSRLDPVPQPIIRARRRVLNHIIALHKGATAARPDLSREERWVPIGQLIESVRLRDYDFLFPRAYTPNNAYYYTYSGYTISRSPYISYGNELGWNISPRFDDEAVGWEVVEAGFIRAILLEPLFWMGLLDVGYAGERAVAYRLTEAGEWVLGIGRELVVPEGEGKVIVQPNFEIFALDPISDLTLARLDEFADRVTAERAIKYRLSRESVYRAQRNGWTAARIIEALVEMSDTPLPQNVERTVQEWQTIHERIRIHRQGSVLQAADGELLDRLAGHPLIDSRLKGRPDRHVALIAPRPGEVEDLVRNLQALGYPPARTRAAGESIPPSFTIDETGQVCFTTELPSIYLYEQIAPFTGRDEQGRYFLTRSAVESALEGGMSVAGILSRLRALHLGPLPRWVEIKVRAWGHYYGDAAIEALILVQFQDKETLRELLAEPELAGILSPFAPDGGKALAVVEREQLERLYEILAERNIGVKEELE